MVIKLKNRKGLVTIFLLVIYGVLLIYPIKIVLIKFGVINFNVSDNWKYYTPTGTNIFGKVKDKIMSLETSIDNRATNYFPFFTGINSSYYKVNMKLDSLLSDEIYVKNNTDNEYIIYNKKDNFYYLINNLSKNEMNSRVKAQAKFYNDINEKYPNINMYVYLPLRYELTQMCTNTLNGYVDAFTSELNDSINVSKLEALSTKEYLNYFYKTDHHYNANGALRAYEDILNMMGIDSTNDFEIKTIKKPYYGSMAKSALNDSISDELQAIDTNIEMSLKEPNEAIKPMVIKDTKNKFYDFYIGYFNGQFDEVTYKYDNYTGRNLLIIGDSISWQIDYLIASKFDETHVINMRFGKWKNNNLKLKEYIEENNITDILFLEEAESQIFDVYNHNLKERVVR